MDEVTKLARSVRQENRFRPQDKLVLHHQFARYMAGERVYPINLEVSPCGTCNATCDFCWYANTGELGEHRNVMLRTDRALAMLDEAARLGVRAVTWTGGGDPSLHSDIDKLVIHAFALGLQQGMFTNALARPRFDPACLQWIRVTRTDKPVRADYVRMLAGAGALGFAYNYAGPRDDQDLRELLSVAETIPDVQYVQVRPALPCHGHTVDIKPPPFHHPLMQVTGYKFDEAKRKHGYERCEGYHFVPFVWEDGNVDTCAYMRKHPGYTLGNIYQSSLKEILDAAPASVAVIDKCQVCCKLHEINLRIQSARRVEDKNFP